MSRGRSPNWRRNRALKCLCGGYWFPHRIHGGACFTSKTHEIHIAKRGGNTAEIAEARLAHVLLHGGITSTDCPF